MPRKEGMEKTTANTLPFPVPTNLSGAQSPIYILLDELIRSKAKQANTLNFNLRGVEGTFLHQGRVYEIKLREVGTTGDTA